MKKALMICLAVLLIAAIGLTGCGKKTDVVKIAHKDYTEQRITGQLLSVYLESKGFDTQVTELTGTMLCYNALKNGDVDVYAEFTGTAYGAIFDQTEIIGVQETYEYVKKTIRGAGRDHMAEPVGMEQYVCVVRAPGDRGGVRSYDHRRSGGGSPRYDHGLRR